MLVDDLVYAQSAVLFARYQLRGSDASEHNGGFLFYFEDARDATVFRLTWCG